MARFQVTTRTRTRGREEEDEARRDPDSGFP